MPLLDKHFPPSCENKESWHEACTGSVCNLS
jgi:hypothetical protein